MYIKNSQYGKAFKYISKVSAEFREKEMFDAFKLNFSIKRNEIRKDKKDYIEKFSRLKQLHK